MKKHTVFLLSIIITIMSVSTLCMTSCKKKNNPSPSTDSGTFLFHFHTQVWDSTIGGNPGMADSSAWVYDSLGRLIYLTVPQFFVSGIKIVNADGSVYSMTNMVILKGLDSEDYLIGKAPAGTYTSAMFTVGLNALIGNGPAPNVLPPTTLFITDGNYFPQESSMWLGSTTAGYNGMIIQGLYDTTVAHTGVNPISFNFQLSDMLTSPASNQVSLPTRGTGAWANYPVYILTAGGTQYIHVLCDYGKLISVINLKTSYSTSVNPLIADSLANNIPNMFRYEQ